MTISVKSLKRFEKLSTYGKQISVIDRQLTKLKESVKFYQDEISEYSEIFSELDDYDLKMFETYKAKLKESGKLIHDLKKQKQTLHRIHEIWKKIDKGFVGDDAIFMIPC